SRRTAGRAATPHKGSSSRAKHAAPLWSHRAARRAKAFRSARPTTKCYETRAVHERRLLILLGKDSDNCAVARNRLRAKFSPSTIAARCRARSRCGHLDQVPYAVGLSCREGTDHSCATNMVRTAPQRLE